MGSSICCEKVGEFKQGLEAGVFNIPLLLGIEAITHLRLALGRGTCSYTKG
jgi:hypothetical protein